MWMPWSKFTMTRVTSNDWVVRLGRCDICHLEVFTSQPHQENPFGTGLWLHKACVAAPLKPKPKDNIMNLDGLKHELKCTSNLAAMLWDAKCLRCTKIKRVVLLRRKTTVNGASEGEMALALKQAEKIRLEFKLTRGEIFDRLYEAPPTVTQVVQDHFKRAAADYNNAVNPNARTKYRMKPAHRDMDVAKDVW